MPWYLCRIWSRHGEVSPHPYPDITSHFMIMSLYEIVPQRFRITTHLWDVTCTAEIVFQTWSIRKFRQRFGKQVFHSDSTPLVRFHVWQNDKDAIERDLPQCRVEVELPCPCVERFYSCSKFNSEEAPRKAADRNISKALMHKRSTTSPNLVIPFHPWI